MGTIWAEGEEGSILPGQSMGDIEVINGGQ